MFGTTISSSFSSSFSPSSLLMAVGTLDTLELEESGSSSTLREAGWSEPE